MDSPENPIVSLANRLRARRDLGAAIDAATSTPRSPTGTTAEEQLRAFAEDLQRGVRRLGSIVGPRALTFVRLEKPLRVRVRFRPPEKDELRVSLDLDAAHELVRIHGLGLDGEYQFDTGAAQPSLINLSKLSTEEGYGDAITASSLLRLLAQDAELPRPSHVDDAGPLQF